MDPKTEREQYILSHAPAYHRQLLELEAKHAALHPAAPPICSPDELVIRALGRAAAVYDRRSLIPGVPGGSATHPWAVREGRVVHEDDAAETPRAAEVSVTIAPGWRYELHGRDDWAGLNVYRPDGRLLITHWQWVAPPFAGYRQWAPLVRAAADLSATVRQQRAEIAALERDLQAQRDYSRQVERERDDGNKQRAQVDKALEQLAETGQRMLLGTARAHFLELIAEARTALYPLFPRTPKAEEGADA